MLADVDWGVLLHDHKLWEDGGQQQVEGSTDVEEVLE